MPPPPLNTSAAATEPLAGSGAEAAVQLVEAPVQIPPVTDQELSQVETLPEAGEEDGKTGEAVEKAAEPVEDAQEATEFLDKEQRRSEGMPIEVRTVDEAEPFPREEEEEEEAVQRLSDGEVEAAGTAITQVAEVSFFNL